MLAAAERLKWFFYILRMVCYSSAISTGKGMFSMRKNNRYARNNEEHQVFRECIPDGSVDLMSLKPGEIIKRQWSFRVNSTPQLQEFITGD